MNKLIDGCIPAGIECPFKNKCELDILCRRREVLDKNFSCAFARAFEITINEKKGTAT